MIRTIKLMTFTTEKIKSLNQQDFTWDNILKSTIGVVGKHTCDNGTDE